jgi:hypothetical protein
MFPDEITGLRKLSQEAAETFDSDNELHGHLLDLLHLQMIDNGKIGGFL